MGRLRSLLRGAWRQLKTPLGVVFLLGSTALTILLLASGLFWAAEVREIEQHQTLEAALRALDDGDYAEARRIAAWLKTQRKPQFGELGGPLYVLGVAMARDAQKQWHGLEREQLYLIAAQYLEQAEFFGFPAGREAQGWYLLGECLFHARRYPQSIRALDKALQAYETPPPSLYRMLSIAHLHDAVPQLEKALQFNSTYLAHENLPPAARYAGLLDRAEITLLLGRLEEGRKTLAELPEEGDWPAERLLMEGRLLLAEGDALLGKASPSKLAQIEPQAFALYGEAIARWEKAQDLATNDSSAGRKSQYLTGLALRRTHDHRAAEKQFARTRRGNHNTPEGQAAAIEEAEIQRLQQKDETALASYRRVLAEIGDGQAYNNPWISLDQLRERMLEAYRDFQSRRRYPYALELARALDALLGQPRSVELQAETQRNWAEYLVGEAESASPSQAESLRAEARTHWLQAGRLSNRLAELEMASRRYPDYLWESAESYLKAYDWLSAVRVLRTYLRTEPRRRRARALVALGEAHLSLGNIDSALSPLMECLRFHQRDPDSYRARLIAAQAYLERGELPEARTLLMDNLHHELLTPRSQEWRDSLFLLGRVAYREGSYWETQSRLKGIDSEDLELRKVALVDLEKSYEAFAQAVSTLDEALRRYPTDPKATRARYLKAEAHRQMAKMPRKKLPTVNIETTRNVLVGEMHQHLNTAIDEYRKLKASLNDQQVRGKVDDVDLTILRNCYFAEADALFDLGRYDEAIRAYSSATNRYQDEPLALEAYVQIASCQRRLNRLREARGTLEQAKVVLKRIREDADFTRTTRYDRAQWVQMLDWLSSI